MLLLRDDGAWLPATDRLSQARQGRQERVQPKRRTIQPGSLEEEHRHPVGQMVCHVAGQRQPGEWGRRCHDGMAAGAATATPTAAAAAAAQRKCLPGICWVQLSLAAAQLHPIILQPGCSRNAVVAFCGRILWLLPGRQSLRRRCRVAPQACRVLHGWLSHRLRNHISLQRQVATAHGCCERLPGRDPEPCGLARKHAAPFRHKLFSPRRKLGSVNDHASWASPLCCGNWGQAAGTGRLLVAVLASWKWRRAS